MYLYVCQCLDNDKAVKTRYQCPEEDVPYVKAVAQNQDEHPCIVAGSYTVRNEAVLMIYRLITVQFSLCLNAG